MCFCYKYYLDLENDFEKNITVIMNQNHDLDQTSRVLYELCSMIIRIFRSPPITLVPLPLLNFLSVSTHSSSASASSPSLSLSSSSPSAFAALFLGVSMAMMLFGSITFLIGLLLLPWVVGLACLFYLAQISYNLSELGRSFLFYPCSFNTSLEFTNCDKSSNLHLKNLELREVGRSRSSTHH